MTVDISEVTGDYVLDPAHTRIGFVARHAMVTKVRGSFHEFEGTAQLDGAEPARSTAQVVIKAESIDTGVEQRDQHLRTNDFLDVPNFPDITFRSTSVEPRSDTNTASPATDHQGHHPPGHHRHRIHRQRRRPLGNLRVGLEGSVTIARKEFGVTWNAPLEGGGVLVGDKITLEFDISAIKQAAPEARPSPAAPPSREVAMHRGLRCPGRIPSCPRTANPVRAQDGKGTGPPARIR